MSLEQWTSVNVGVLGVKCYGGVALSCASFPRVYSLILSLRGQQFYKVSRSNLLIRHPDARYGESNTKDVSWRV